MCVSIPTTTTCFLPNFSNSPKIPSEPQAEKHNLSTRGASPNNSKTSGTVEPIRVAYCSVAKIGTSKTFAASIKNFARCKTASLSIIGARNFSCKSTIRRTESSRRHLLIANIVTKKAGPNLKFHPASKSAPMALRVLVSASFRRLGPSLASDNTISLFCSPRNTYFYGFFRLSPSDSLSGLPFLLATDSLSRNSIWAFTLRKSCSASRCNSFQSSGLIRSRTDFLSAILY